MIFAEILFWIAVYLLFHSYLFYPFFVFVASRFIKRDFRFDEDYKPSVSVLIAAYNEKDHVAETIKKIMASDYNQDKMEILVGSDNSNDGTNEILVELSQSHSNLKVFIFRERRGKAIVLNDLVKLSNNEILVFVDANTFYDPAAIGEMVKYYQDSRIGGVSGKLLFVEDNSNDRLNVETNYWKAESIIKEFEGKIGYLIGANGGIYSIRKELYAVVPDKYSISDDLYISIKILEQKKYFLYNKNAIGRELTTTNHKAEFNRRIRYNFFFVSTISSIKKLLKPEYGLVAFMLWSHKIIRWFTSVIFIVLFLTNLFLQFSSQFYYAIFICQVIFYAIGIMGYFLLSWKSKFNIPMLVYYFIFTNVAMLLGIIKFFTSKQGAVWTTVREK
jgi:cellulose synthase/poly-beta-1,6-N-acetylglucosamine synthase-like glycosyltransferase